MDQHPINLLPPAELCDSFCPSTQVAGLKKIFADVGVTLAAVFNAARTLGFRGAELKLHQ